MSKSLFRDKYVRKFQQGGGMITPLNPNVFRTPMQSIDSSMFAKTISPGVDINIILNENARRENAALAREKMKHDLDLLDRRAALEEDGKIFDMIMGDLSSTGGTPTSKTGNPIYYNNDITTSKRFEQDKLKHTEKTNQIVDSMLKARSLPGDQRLSTIFKLKNEYTNHLASFPANALLKADELIYKRMIDVASDPKSKLKVNKAVFNDWVIRRNKWLNMEEGTDAPDYYKLGEEPLGLYYDYDSTKKVFDDLLTNINTPVEIDQEVIVDGRIIKQRKRSALLDSETAADRLSTTIMSNRDLLSFMQDQYGLNLTYTPGSEESVRNVIKDIIKNNIQFDDNLRSGGISYSDEYKGTMSEPDKTTTVRYITDKDGNKVSVDENTYNKILVQDFTNRHFNPKTGVIDAKSAANDLELNDAVSSFLNILVPPISGSASDTYSKISGETYSILAQIAKEFLLAGGQPTNPQYLDIISPIITQVLIGTSIEDVPTSISNMKDAINELNLNQKYKDNPFLAPLGIQISGSTKGSSTSVNAEDIAKQAKGAGGSTGTKGVPDYAK